jgi:hypothetical protein
VEGSVRVKSVSINTVEPESGCQYRDPTPDHLLSLGGRTTATSEERLRNHVWQVSL